MSHSNNTAVSSSRRASTIATIVESAARVLATRQDASIAEIAAAGGVSRATIYRHFPTRDALLRALADSASADAQQRLADANLDNVPIDDGIARAARALVAVGNRYPAAVQDLTIPGTDNPAIREPVTALLQRGQADGRIRSDVPLDCLLESLLALVAACLRSGSHLGQGTEDISATIVRLFLEGATERT
jgi:TetR/AcrR family transcriptional regulator, mexCD-oprJ operon repressor